MKKEKYSETLFVRIRQNEEPELYGLLLSLSREEDRSVNSFAVRALKKALEVELKGE